MWKDEYKIGNELIDAQHRGLFETTDKLLRIIEGADPELKKQECINMILFAKEYAIKHFADEEAYQEQMNYGDLETHKALHRSFAAKVDIFEKELIESEFSVQSIKEFIGFLTIWLIYHVAGVDQKLKSNEKIDDDKEKATGLFVDCFAKSVGEVLSIIAGLVAENIEYVSYFGGEDDIRIEIKLSGEYKGEAVFSFSREIAFNLIKIMMAIEVETVDELVNSALSEMANIISGKASTLISQRGKTSVIDAPKVINEFKLTDDRSGFYVSTELGDMAVSVNIS